VTNFAGESTTFYRNLGHGMFADQGRSIGLTAPSRFLLGFGAALLDVNNDDALDLMTASTTTVGSMRWSSRRMSLSPTFTTNR
jgi:hypothetical protein